MTHQDGADQNKLATAIGRGIGAVSTAAARHAAATLAVIAVVTLVLGAGLADVRFEENLLEILPRGHPDTDANLAVHDEFPGHYSYVNINFKTDPSKWHAANDKLPHRVPPEQMQNGPVGAHNVTDEVYLRALEEYYQEWVRDPAYLPAHMDVFNVAWNSHVKLINYTNSFSPGDCAGEPPEVSCFDPDAYSFPGTDPVGSQQFAIAWQTVYTAAPEETSTQASPDWDMTRSVYVYLPVRDGDTVDYNDVGARAKAAWEAYSDAVRACDETPSNCSVKWNVFDVDKSGPSDAKIVTDAHGTALAREDLVQLAPLVGVFILASLWWAFRSPKAVLVAITSLILGTVWTYGIMGYMDIPLNTLNLTIVPLILGVGIDYSIHMTNEYLEHKARGTGDAEAFRKAGERSGFAMLVATVTTVTGLLIVFFSPSKLISQMGLLSAIALACIYLLAIVFIPAALVAVRVRGGGHYASSALMPAAGRAVTRRRGAVLLVVLVLSGTLFASAQGVLPGSRGLEYEAFGNPALNFPRGDPVREWYEEGQAAFFGTSERAVESNWVILQGDLTTPEAHRYVKALQDELAANPQIRDDSVTSIWNLVLQWEQLKRGTPAALATIGQGELHRGTGEDTFDPYPQSQEEIERALDEMFACECMRVYASLFINPDYDLSVILIDTGTGGTYAGAKTIIDDVKGTIEREDMRALQEEADLEVALGGYTAFSVAFIEGQMPWVTYMALASAGTVAAIILLVWRDLRATLAVVSLIALTSLWWLGSLPVLGIGLAVTLTLPLVFINCIGTDYGLHLIWSAKKDGSMESAMRNTGKAVLFSAITTLGAFSLFVPMTNLMMTRSMTATTFAIFAIFTVTALVIPLFYPVRTAADEEARRARVKAVPVAPARPREDEDAVVVVRRPPR